MSGPGVLHLGICQLERRSTQPIVTKHAFTARTARSSRRVWLTLGEWATVVNDGHLGETKRDLERLRERLSELRQRSSKTIPRPRVGELRLRPPVPHVANLQIR